MMWAVAGVAEQVPCWRRHSKARSTSGPECQGKADNYNGSAPVDHAM